MVSFGDIEIPWLTSKDTSISKDTVEKNFVDETPQVYELTADLEAGSYSAILNENVQSKNESFEEQQDAVLSMVSRHGTEFPFQASGDNGYILVNSASVNTFPSLEIREGELSVRFLEQSDYYSAIKAYPQSHPNGDFDASADPEESFIALPSSLNVINTTSDYTVTSEDGDLSLYTFSGDTVFEFEQDSNDITLSQTHSICRLTNSAGERIYSDKRVADVGSDVQNGLVSVSLDSSSSPVDYYNGTSWVSIGTTQLPFDDGYAHENSNDEIVVEAINDNRASIHRGFSTVRYDFEGQTSFDFTPATSFTEQSVNDYYAHWQDGNSRDIIIVRTSSDGSFYTGTDNIGIQNLTDTTRYSVFVGVVPGSITVSDYARFVYNYGLRNRTFTQK